MNNNVVNYHPTLGIITFEDLVKYLDNVIKDYKFLEDKIYDILKYNNYDDEIIASLFVSNIQTSLINIYDFLISLL